MIERFIDWKHRINWGETRNFALYAKPEMTLTKHDSEGNYIYDPDLFPPEDAPDEYEDEYWFDDFGRLWRTEHDEFGNPQDSIILTPEHYIYTGVQFCPECMEQIPKNGDVFECPKCGWSIDISNAEMGEGCPTLAAASDYAELDNYRDVFEFDPDDL